MGHNAVLRMQKNIRNGAAVALALSVVAGQAVAQADGQNRDRNFLTNLDVSGVVQTDYSYVSGDVTDFEVRDFSFRRGRVGASGILFEAVKFKIVLDVDHPRDAYLTDAYISFRPGAAPVDVKLGQFKTANSLDEQTSSRFISTLERAAFTDAFGLGRGVGVSVTNKGSRHSVTLGVLGRDIRKGTFDGYMIAGRATYVPIASDELKTHLGVSFRYRENEASEGLFAYGQGPVASPAGDIVTTAGLANSDLFLGAEAALVKGRFWGAGEFGTIMANCNSCASDPTLSGGYVEAGLFINGRRSLKGGRFDRPEVFSSITNGGCGAYSLVARLDLLDLNDSGVNGGDYQSITLGADWWPTSNTRFGINLFKVDASFGDVVSRLDPVFATAVSNGIFADDAYGLNLRFQIDI